MITLNHFPCNLFTKHVSKDAPHEGGMSTSIHVSGAKSRLTISHHNVIFMCCVQIVHKLSQAFWALPNSQLEESIQVLQTFRFRWMITAIIIAMDSNLRTTFLAKRWWRIE